MRARRAIRFLAGLAAIPVIAGAWPTAAPAFSYRLTDLGVLNGKPASAGRDINFSGQIAGWSGSISVEGKSAIVRNAFLYTGTMHDLRNAHPEYPVSEATGINDSGHITGRMFSTVTGHRAFLYDGTVVHDLGTLGGTLSGGQAINNSGQVVGWSLTAGGEARAFLYDGAMHELETPAAGASVAYGINDQGQIAGTHLSEFSVHRAFLWTPTSPNGNSGTMSDLGVPPNRFSSAHAVNADGFVTGFVGTGDGFRAFLHDGTTMHLLDTIPGFNSSIGLGINDHGQVVGLSSTDWSIFAIDPISPRDVPYSPYSATRAFIYSSESGVVDLNSLVDLPPGVVLHAATAINNRGQITGYLNDGALRHAFLLTPVPEPGTTASVIALACALSCVRRRQSLPNKSALKRGPLGL